MKVLKSFISSILGENMLKLSVSSICILSMIACTPSTQETINNTPENSQSKKATQTKNYNPNKNVYFGDLHIHTKNSFDAYIFNVRSTPDDVYRFAKGETLVHPSGFEMAIGGEPLDFVSATDHGAYMGILPEMNNPDSPLSKLDMAKEMFGTDPELIVRAFNKIGDTVRSGIPFPLVYDKKIIQDTWQRAVSTANKHYEPGKLTTFSGYEYTSVDGKGREQDGFAGGNLHRNVIFENMASDRVFSTLDSTNPEDLWDWMDSERNKGRDVIAIPHNSNVSDGKMFATKTYNGDNLDLSYAEQRIKNEPIVEITQVKGTSETHPLLSPNDEWANFEIYEKLLASQVTSKINGSYVRDALATGLSISKKTGSNPFKFGVIGSSDSHVAGGSYDEKDYWSKVGILDSSPEKRGSIPPNGSKSWEGIEQSERSKNWYSKWGASGLAAIWAEENTRESLFSGMRNKETYATTGPRIKLRVFAGYDYDTSILNDPNMVQKAYKLGVPMGGELRPSNHAPSFIVWAMRDPRNAPLQRIQMIKVWNENGDNKEKIYDIICADELTPDAKTNYCPDNGSTVNLKDCSVSSDKGAPELKVLWTDPQFNSGDDAAYYIRVLENPTCRWSTWDAIKAGVSPSPNLPPTIQERAYGSAIWYNSKKS
jgi:hypothetical protein